MRSLFPVKELGLAALLAAPVVAEAQDMERSGLNLIVGVEGNGDCGVMRERAVVGEACRRLRGEAEWNTLGPGTQKHAALFFGPNFFARPNYPGEPSAELELSLLGARLRCDGPCVLRYSPEFHARLVNGVDLSVGLDMPLARFSDSGPVDGVHLGFLLNERYFMQLDAVDANGQLDASTRMGWHLPLGDPREERALTLGVHVGGWDEAGLLFALRFGEADVLDVPR